MMLYILRIQSIIVSYVIIFQSVLPSSRYYSCSAWIVQPNPVSMYPAPHHQRFVVQVSSLSTTIKSSSWRRSSASSTIRRLSSLRWKPTWNNNNNNNDNFYFGHDRRVLRQPYTQQQSSIIRYPSSLVVVRSTSSTSTSINSESKVVQSHEEEVVNQPKLVLQRQKVAVIGSGAVGCYYGGHLWCYGIGHDVQFYMRNEQYDTAKEDGILITSDIHKKDIIIPSEQVYNDITQMQKADWIIVAFKSTGLHDIPRYVIPLLKDDNSTRLLIIMNGMIEKDIVRYLKEAIGQCTTDNPNEPFLKCRTIYGGMALLCSNRIAPARIHHSYFGLLSAGVASTNPPLRSTTGSSSSEDIVDDSDEVAFMKLFYKDQVSTNDIIPINIQYEPCLLRGRWKKMVWNLPFNGISVAMGGITVDEIVLDPNLRQLAYSIMDETILVANTELHDLYNNTMLPSDISEQQQQQFYLGAKDKVTMMQLSDDMGPYKPSTMLDFINRRSMEVHYLFEVPLERARYYNLSTPYLETIVSFIQAYQKKYQLY